MWRALLAGKGSVPNWNRALSRASFGSLHESARPSAPQSQLPIHLLSAGRHVSNNMKAPCGPRLALWMRGAMPIPPWRGAAASERIAGFLFTPDKKFSGISESRPARTSPLRGLPHPGHFVYAHSRFGTISELQQRRLPMIQLLIDTDSPPRVPRPTKEKTDHTDTTRPSPCPRCRSSGEGYQATSCTSAS